MKNDINLVRYTALNKLAYLLFTNVLLNIINIELLKRYKLVKLYIFTNYTRFPFRL